jgi:sRNA-binding protein
MAATVEAVEARQETARSAASAAGDRIADAPRVSAGELKDALLDEVRKSRKYFYGTVVAQAQRIDIEGDRIVFTFAPHQGTLRVQLDQAHAWLDPLVSRLSGRRMTVVSAEGTAAEAKPGTPAPAASEKDRQSDLRQQALADSKVQTMLDVFGAEIKDVEEM